MLLLKAFFFLRVGQCPASCWMTGPRRVAHANAMALANGVSLANRVSLTNGVSVHAAASTT